MGNLIRHLLRTFIWSLVLTQISADVVIDSGRGHNTCGPYGNRITAESLLIITRQMAIMAIDYMDRSTELAQNGEFWEYYKLMSTFDIFFDATNNDGFKNRWDTVRDNLERMASVKEVGTDKIYMFCDDDDPVITVDGSGNKIFHDPIDNIEQNMGPHFMTCKEANSGEGNMGGYRSGFGLNTGMNYIVLCLKQNQDKMTTKSPKRNDILVDTTDFYTTFFHELSHAVLPNNIRDPNGQVTEPGERWGWLGAEEVRSTYALQNPDSLMLFAHCLSMAEELYWYSGLANDRYHTYVYLANFAPQTIQNFNLPEPPPPEN